MRRFDVRKDLHVPCTAEKSCFCGVQMAKKGCPRVAELIAVSSPTELPPGFVVDGRPFSVAVKDHRSGCQNINLPLNRVRQHVRFWVCFLEKTRVLRAREDHEERVIVYERPSVLVGCFACPEKGVNVCAWFGGDFVQPVAMRKEVFPFDPEPDASLILLGTFKCLFPQQRWITDVREEDIAIDLVAELVWQTKEWRLVGFHLEKSGKDQDIAPASSHWHYYAIDSLSQRMTDC